jgi:hypothetical protein
MYVEVTGSGAAVREAHDLGRLEVRASAGAQLVTALAGLGTVGDDGSHVWLGVDALRDAARATVPDVERHDWVERFDAMIAYAGSKGWLSADGQAVRAHLA